MGPLRSISAAPSGSMRTRGVLVVADEGEPCGTPLAEIAFPDQLPESLASIFNPEWQDAFSPDWRHVASGSEEGTIRVWELDKTAMAYTERYTLGADEGSHEGASKFYHHPKFAPDGETLWFGVSSSDENSLGHIPYEDHTSVYGAQDGGSLLAFDEPWTVDDSGTVLTESENVETESVEVDGAVMEFEYWVNDAGEIVNPDQDSGPLIEFPGTNNLFGAPVGYSAIHQLSPTEFLMGTSSGYSSDFQEILDSYGEIAHATIDPDQGTFELEQRVPADAESRLADWTLVHPDGTTVYLGFDENEDEDEDREDWEAYSASLAPEDDEEPQDLDPEFSCLAGKDISWS